MQNGHDRFIDGTEDAVKYNVLKEPVFIPPSSDPRVIASARIKKVWELYATDGGGMGRHCGTKGYYSSEPSISDPFMSKKEVDVLEVFGDFYLLKRREPIDVDGLKAKRQQEIKNEALKKLTEEERKVLGLPDVY